MARKLEITISGSFQEEARRDLNEYRRMSAEERLNLVELLRLEAGKVVYEYPARFRRILTIARKA